MMELTKKASNLMMASGGCLTLWAVLLAGLELTGRQLMQYFTNKELIIFGIVLVGAIFIGVLIWGREEPDYIDDEDEDDDDE